MAPGKKTVIRDEWLTGDKYPWLEKVDRDPHSARCKWCDKKFSLSNMGQKALTSHAMSTKHKKSESFRLNTAKISDVLQLKDVNQNEPKTSLPSSPAKDLDDNAKDSVPTAPSPSNPPKANLQRYLIRDDVTTAEIFWCIHTVMAHASIRGGAAGVKVFKRMFPDSEIAGGMALQKTKIGYTITYGLAPYFHSELREQCNTANYLVVGFDESLNKVVQKGQMDVVVRYWNTDKEEVSTRYFDSAFLGHATAVNLLNAFLDATTDMDLRKLLQVSMDGPNVNVKFFKDLKSYLKGDPQTPTLLDLGSCGLHAVNNAFKNASRSIDWEIPAFLRCIYYLFSNVPVRRADYRHYTDSSEFPLKFCAIRWIENEKVAERAIRIIPHLEKYVKKAKADKKAPSCDSFKTVCKLLEDPLLRAKLGFFQSIASVIEPFLTKFQSDDPLAPLLYESLLGLMKTLMARFVKQEVLEKEVNVTKIDLDDEKNLSADKAIHLGYVTSDALRPVRKLLTDRDILQFRH